ncbi:MAG: hypothetical protein EA427_04265 [Spirochaetaceae bacterium]|nr:MAG: hypothetical protein EA427_04265 [Spirochaetaceae bacterium]
MRSVVSVCILITVFTVFLPAQQPGVPAPEAVQPRVILVFGVTTPEDTAVTEEARELLETAIEGELRSSLRYVLTRTRTADAPERHAPGLRSEAAVFARTAPRRDGSLRVELDIWRDGRFVWSLESQLPLGRERFRVAADLARSVERELARTFPGFGRIAFRNTGFDQPYYVYANGTLIGVSPRALELTPGTYNMEIRRRDEGFEHVVGRRSVTLRDEDFLELRFRMERNPPPVPGFLRLTDPTDRWNALFDIRGAVMIPQQGFGDLEGVGYGAFATALFNHVLFTGHVFGFEAGYINYRPDGEMDGLDLEMEITSLIATTGISVGPVSKVDYIVRAGGGMALTRTKVWYDPIGIAFKFDDNGYAPAFAGSMEFGFGVGEAMRFSLNISYQGIYEEAEDQVFSFIGLGLGLGGRF